MRCMQRKYATVEWELKWAWQVQESGSMSLPVYVCVCVRHVCVAGLQLCALFFNLLRAHNKSLLLSFSSNCSSYDAGCSSSTLAPVGTPTTTGCLRPLQYSCQLFNAHGEFANVTCQCVRAGKGKISQRQRRTAAEAQVLGLC